MEAERKGRCVWIMQNQPVGSKDDFDDQLCPQVGRPEVGVWPVGNWAHNSQLRALICCKHCVEVEEGERKERKGGGGGGGWKSSGRSPWYPPSWWAGPGWRLWWPSTGGWGQVRVLATKDLQILSQNGGHNWWKGKFSYVHLLSFVVLIFSSWKGRFGESTRRYVWHTVQKYRLTKNTEIMKLELILLKVMVHLLYQLIIPLCKLETNS